MADFTTNLVTKTSGVEYLVGQTVDTVLNYSPATLFFLGKQKKWQGTQMRFPIKYATNSQGMNFDGLQKFSTTRTDQFTYGYFSPTGYSQPCIISQMEVDVSETNNRIPIIARQLASDAQDMASAIATQFYTLQTGIAFNSLTDICDDGTIGATLWGGISRTTYSGTKGNYTNINGNLTLANLRTAYNLTIHGPESPNLILTSKAIFGYYEKLANPTLVHNAPTMNPYASFVGAGKNGLPNLVSAGPGMAANMGFRALYWEGVPVIADEVVPSGYLYMLNTNSIAFYGVASTDPDYKPVKFYSDTMDSVYNVPATSGFSFSGFNKPIDQYAKVGHIILAGNLIGKNPRLNGVLINVTGA